MFLAGIAVRKNVMTSNSAGPRQNRRRDRSSLAGSGLLIDFLLCLRLTYEIAQREGQVGQDPE
jgi:hypothetical protein